MRQLWKIVNYLILGAEAIICLLGTFYKHISFGWGLGDLIWYGIIYSLTITHLLITLQTRKKNSSQYFPLAIFFLITTIYICLKATIWRGAEYKWNGEIFYNN